MTPPTQAWPFFSVVMATADRGKHILPSVASVLAQDWPHFELIVVGDGCTDETESVLRDTFGARLRWINLPRRRGSQSFPNNAGIAAAQGSHIAYLGHDDIWATDHLSRLAALFTADANLGIAVSGCAYHLPSGMAPPIVTGIFAPPQTPQNHFFPPSSLAHVCNLTNSIGPWADPFDIRAPVDCDLLIRAHAAGFRFASTGCITVHKFAAGHRYLSYLWHDTNEQEAALARLAAPDSEHWVQSLLRSSQKAGRFMVMQYLDFASLAPGEMARENLARKGLRAEAAPLVDERVVVPETLPTTFDWATEPQNGILWSAGNPFPRILLPVSGPAQALLVAEFVHPEPAGLERVSGQTNGQAVRFEMGPALPSGDHWSAFGSARIFLRDSGPTALELCLEDGQRPVDGARGLGYGRLVFLPLPDTQATDLAEQQNTAGLTAYAAGQSDVALAAFKDAVATSPVHAPARANLAILSAEHGDIAAAELHARIAVALQPDNLSAWVALGRLALAAHAPAAIEAIATQLSGLRDGSRAANDLRQAMRRTRTD